MKTYVLIFGIATLLSLCFVDPGIQPAIAKVGRWSLLVTSVLFLISGAVAVFS